jgi:hypothetical protein
VDGIVNGSNVSEVYMEMKAGDNFTLFANNVPCGTFNATPGNFSVNNWSVASCVSFIYPGAENNISINFTGSNITNAFIGGGYIRVTYSTDNLLENENARYRFPGINGLVNLYDSFHVPGNITGMNATVKFFAPANYTTILNIGNVTVINYNGTGSDVTIALSNSTLEQAFAAKGISYFDLSDKTVPVRMFVGANITGGTVNGTADVVLITDTSGSMAWRLNQDFILGNTINDCNDPAIYDNTTSRISLAKCLDKTFVNALLGGNSSCGVSGSSGNRVGLVSFSSSANTWEGLTNNISLLESRINAYGASGSTCVSCAINRAYNILSSQSTPGRTRYIIMMTDGVANIRSTPACYDMNDVSEGFAVGESVYATGPPWIGSTFTDSMNNVDSVGAAVRAVSNGGEVYSWNGASWILEQVTGADNLYGVDLFNSTLGFAVGASAKIWHWNGTAWSQMDDFGSFNFRSVAVFNSTLGFAVGESGRIYEWNGTAWSLDQDVGSNNLYGVAVQSGMLAFAVGTSGKIYTWNGASWSETTDTGSNTHYEVAFVNSTKAFTVSSNGRVYEWNGGSWTSTAVSSYPLNGLHVSGNLAFATGDGRGDIYGWDGTAWSRTFSSFYYEGTATSGLDCGDDDTCSLSVPQSYPALNANYSAARAKQNINNLTIDSIGFGPIGSCTLGNQTIVEVARSGNGTAYSSASGSELQGIYCQIANNLITKTTETQQIITEGTLQPSTLYDSSIDFDYMPSTPLAGYQEISISSETPAAPGCTVSFFVPSNIRLADAFRTSYSGFFWTKTMSVQNSATPVVYNLSSYGSTYTLLGDPFRIYLPVSKMLPDQTNNVTNELGLNSSFTNATCSGYDRIIYRALMRASAPFGSVFPKMSGGVARVYHDTDHDGTADGYDDITFGAGLPGFDPSVRTIDQLDPENALHDALIRLLASLNLVTGTGLPGTDTNPIDVMLGQINVDATGTSGIPFAWGPIDVRLDVKI